MNILENYPVFENNQVLTSDQLNNLVKYLDQQNRLTRSRLIGIGVICGFNLEYISSDNKLLISKGIGVTSEGYLIAQDDCPTFYYRDYKLPQTASYPPFEDPLTNKQDVNLELFELLTTDPSSGSDPSILRLDKLFLKDKVVILFLEIFDQDIKTCLAKSCDEIGQTRLFTLRKLLVSATDLDDVLSKLNIDSYDPTFPSKFELPVMNLPRVTIKPDESAAHDKYALLTKYRDASLSIMDELIDAIKLSYTTYQPIFNKLYKKDYFGINKDIDILAAACNKYLTDDSVENPFYGMQYFYDFMKDLILAYNEFKDTAFELCNECIIDIDRFPQHLMVGPAIPEKDYNIDSTPYRNRYIQSPAYSKQKYLTEKTRSLHQRLVSLMINFKLDFISKPDNSLLKTFIIPSHEKITKLSQRSIPFYYTPDKGDIPLINCWNFDIEKRKQSDYILTYHHQSNSNDPAKTPLKFDLDKYSFLRIEGVLGKEANSQTNALNAKKVEFNLPINILTLKISPSPETLVLNQDLWNDLNAAYYESCGRFKCVIQNLYSDIKKLKGYNLQIDFTTIDPDKVKSLIDDITSCLPENVNNFVFPLFFSNYNHLIELMQEYKLSLIHLQGKLINVLINVTPIEKIQNNLTAIEESLDFIQRLLINCTYREFYLIYHRLIGRKKYLMENHPMIFSNFIKRNPGIDHEVGVKKGGTYLMVIEDNTPEEGKNKVFAEFSLPYLCCCECSDLPTIEEELDYNLLPELALPDGAICIKNNKVDIDILQNDYIPYTGKFDITTNSQYASYNPNKKLISYKRDNYLGLDTFHYTIKREIKQIDNSIQSSVNELVITPDDLIANSLFGFSLDIDQGKAIIGALKGGDKSVNSGSAYIFELINNQWKQQAKLLPSDKENDDQFGCSVAISGNYAFVGAKGEDTSGNMAGSVYVFAYENKNWVEKQKLQPNDISAGDYFGCSITIFNNLLIIGAFGKDGDVKNCGCAYFFKLESNKWVQKQKITASDLATGDYFGYDVALYNNSLVIGAYCKDSKGFNSGCTYVYSYNGTQFIEKQKLIPYDLAADDYFGSSVAIYENTIVIGARRNDISGKNSGSAYVFNYQQNSWVEIQKLIPFDAESGDYIGYSVDIFKDTIIIGSRYEDKGGENIGAAYLFTYENGKWEQSKKVQPEKLQPNNLFGSAVGIFNDIIIVAAHKSNSNAGSIFIFSKQSEIANNIASVIVLAHEEYTHHILAKDDIQIVQQHDEVVIDVLENDVYYNNTELVLPVATSLLGGIVSIIPVGSKKQIKFVPGNAGKDKFIYQLKDEVRNETSEATVNVLVTKFDLTIPDLVYLVTSTSQNSIPIILSDGWTIDNVSSIPSRIGSLTIDLRNSAIVFVPGIAFTTNKTFNFSYTLLNNKGEIVKGIVHLINSLDEYSVPDIVYRVTKKASNTIPIEYAKQNNLVISRAETSPENIGTLTIDGRNNNILFKPSAVFPELNTSKIIYYLENSSGFSIKGIVHLVYGFAEYPIPDIVYQVTELGRNIIPISYASQNKLEITGIISHIPSEAGSLTINKETIVFETGLSYSEQNSLRFSYQLNNNGETIIGNVYLINSLKQSEEYKDYFSEVMAGTVMAFAFDPSMIDSNEIKLISAGTKINRVMDILIKEIGLKEYEAKVLFESTPTTIIKGSKLLDATRIRNLLEDAGASVEVINWFNNNGWLICDAKTYDRKQYERLFKRIGTTYGPGDGKNTFNVPELRGEFLRGCDYSEDNKKGRAIGTRQYDQLQSHGHQGSITADGNHYHVLPNIVKDTGGAYGTPISGGKGLGITWPGYNGTPHPNSAYSGSHSHAMTIGSLTALDQGIPRFGNETRPDNIAVLFCIKY